jgi:hypothetical protein
VDHPGGLQGSLETSGTDLQALLARLQAVPPQRHFATGDGWVLALAHELDPALRLSRAEAEVAGLHLTLRLPAMHRIPGELEISVAPGDDIELPEDLLAVLGWQWSRLTPIAGRWTVALRPRGQGPQRTADAERRLQEALAHLAHTLAEPPARFHERQLRARWRFTLRRAVPLAGCFALMGAAVALPQLDLAPDSVFRMLIFNGPPILMVALFSMRELPRVEIPPRPRASTAPAWRPAPPARPTPLQGDPCPPTR